MQISTAWWYAVSCWQSLRSEQRTRFSLLSHGSRNDSNDLAHFKASSLPPRIVSSHVWFIIRFHTLPFSCQQHTLLWKVQGETTQVVNRWTSQATFIFQALHYFISDERVEPLISDNKQFLLTNTSTSYSIYSPVITRHTATTWARTPWRGSCTYQTLTPGGSTGPECCPARWIHRQTPRCSQGPGITVCLLMRISAEMEDWRLRPCSQDLKVLTRPEDNLLIRLDDTRIMYILNLFHTLIRPYVVELHFKGNKPDLTLNIS